MLPKTIILATSLMFSQLSSPVLSCDPHSLKDRDGIPAPIPGSDDPADPATTGYFINHLSLNVKNLTASIDFYYKVFGVRHIFTLPATDHLSIAYMGHAQGGRNGTGYQTQPEIEREKNNNAGLIEMIHLDIPSREDLPASSQESNTFGHIGMIVPDPEAAQERFKSLGVKILKDYGAPTPSEGPIAIANGFPPEAWAEIEPEERKAIEAIVSGINTRFIYVEDPDGNIIEVQPQD